MCMYVYMHIRVYEVLQETAYKALCFFSYFFFAVCGMTS